MRKQLQKMIDRGRKQSGQGLVEYALILSLIATVAILVLRGVGTNANSKLGSVNSNLASGGDGDGSSGGGNAGGNGGGKGVGIGGGNAGGNGGGKGNN